MSMADFLEERLPIDVRMGASYADEYAVEIVTTQNNAEYRRLLNPYPVRQFSINYTQLRSTLWSQVLALYHRAFGLYAGFRVKCADDFSTNGNTGAPTAFDHAMQLISTGVYQLQKLYGLGAASLGIGYPYRTLYKPVSGTVRVGVNGAEIATSPVANWSVDNTTGRVTFAANKTANVSGAISKAASAVIPCAGHSFLVGESVHIAGVLSMIEINGLRGNITAITPGVDITVSINSTTFSTWTSGGVLNTRPQTGELVYAGCEFDLPCRFNSRIDVAHIGAEVREAGTIDIIELVVP